MNRRRGWTGPKYRDNGYVEYRYYDHRGKRKSVYGKTDREARSKLHAALAQVDDLTVRPEMRVGGWLDRWLEDEQDKAKKYEGTTERQEYALRMVPDWFRDLRLHEVKPRDVNRMLNELLTEPAPNRSTPYAGSTVGKCRATLSKVFGDALRNDLVKRNVVALSDPVDTTPRPAKPMTREDATRWLAEVAEHRLQSMFMAAVMLGLRESELINLRWRDVDLKARTLSVTSQSPRTPSGKVSERPPKSRAGVRTLALPSQLHQALTARRREGRKEALRKGYPFDRDTLVWPSLTGTRLLHRNVLRTFKLTLEHAGLEDRRFHDLRHSAGSILLALGLSEREIMDILGHDDLRMIGTYQHVSDDVRHRAARAIEEGWA